MTQPYTPLPWRLDDIAQRIIGMRDSQPVIVATGLIARDARFILAAANTHLPLVDIALRVRAMLVQLSHDDITALRLELIELFNTLLTRIDGGAP